MPAWPCLIRRDEWEISLRVCKIWGVTAHMALRTCSFQLKGLICKVSLTSVLSLKTSKSTSRIALSSQLRAKVSEQAGQCKEKACSARLAMHPRFVRPFIIDIFAEYLAIHSLKA